MSLFCDNKSTISIAPNLVQHDRTKHVEVDRHFIKEKLDSDLIRTLYISSSDQLADVLIKGLPAVVCHRLISKIEIYDIHSQS